MRVCFFCTLFWLAHLSISNRADTEESYKPRRWSAASNGPYRLVVSSESETLTGEESVSLVVAQEKKKKEKAVEEGLTEKYDKVTQRMSLKRGRKRERKRGRPLTTGPPQTVPYSLYNHFRPLETDLPRESLVPFLDFGRKLSTPGGVNSIESSSTPRGEPPPVPVEDLLTDEEMDVAVVPKVVERNFAPRGPPLARHNIAASFFRRNTTQLATVRTALPRTSSNDYLNKTETKNVHYDLQSNESGINVHAVLSPNYGLKLNKTETQTQESSTQVPLNITNTENSTIAEPAKPTVEMAQINMEEPMINASKIGDITTNKTKNAEDAPSVSPPKPTARILSTAVVTSVSVKESPWLPRIKTNLTRPELYQRLNLKNNTSEIYNLTSHLVPETRVRFDNHTNVMQQNFRRKMYTTMRPKTTTYRPITFRSVFRRNFTGLGAGVVHILSTPPTYIEVPKILAKTSDRIVKNETPLVKITQTSNLAEPSENTTVSKPDLTSTILTTYPQTLPPPSVSTTDFPTSTQSTPYTTLPTIITTIQSTTPPTKESTTPSTTSTTTTTPPPTTEFVRVTSSTTSKSNESILIADLTAPDISQTNIPEISDSANNFSHNADKVPIANATVEIEFKPLDVHAISTTEIFNRSVTRRPFSQRNHSVVRTQPVGVAYPDSHIGLVTYVLAGLALIPLILGLSVLARQLFRKSKKKVLDESEYSSEYNRTPLPTKLPRVPAHINWEGEKQTPPTAPAPLPVTKWEFSRNKLRLQTVLGQGNFGQVWKAEADDLSGHEGSTRLVAVKTVKEGSTLREKEDLLRELGIMQELGAHPNVVTLLGCCTDKEPYLLIMEYVMYGKLLAFLREHRTRAHYFNFSDLSSALTSRDLTFFSYCVARGMEYLVAKGIIHRDLAARNILVDHTKLCKIADFGMSRNVRDTGQIYEQRPNRGALPIRWMAPESLHMSLFTHKSDVWSFGILLWEIITLGSTPYNKMGAREVMREVREGYRLEKPKHCRPEFYKVVSKCWHNDPSKRPSFSELKQDLAALLADESTNGEYVDLDALTEEMCDQST